MMFSIIIPIYKAENYLSACIESILNQTYKNWELILVDDGSPDNSGAICDAYVNRETNNVDQRIRVIHQNNGGPSSARNHGLEYARGEYITFVDSDDWVTPDYLEKLVVACQDVDLLFFSAIWHYSDGCRVTYSLDEFHLDGKENVESEIYHLIKNEANYLYFGYTVNKVFRKSIIDNYHIRFRNTLKISEDEVFTHDYVRYVNNIRYIDEPLYQYRIHPMSLTNRIKTPIEFISISDCLLEVSNYYTNSKLAYSIRARAINLRWEAFEGEHKFNRSLFLLMQINKYCNQYNIPFSLWTLIRILVRKLFKK